MNHQDFTALVKQPEKLSSVHLYDLREIVKLYPAFVQARVLYVKALQQSQSVHFAANLKLAVLYSSNRRWLYYFMHPEKKLSIEPYRREKTTKSHGDYFDMIENLEREGGDTKQSLRNLAERLKSARVMVVNPSASVKDSNQNTYLKTEIASENIVLGNQDVEITENLAKNLIYDKKYIEAIEILKKLNLNNPKKSVYFADQIRFLEKVIANSKK